MIKCKHEAFALGTTQKTGSFYIFAMLQFYILLRSKIFECYIKIPIYLRVLHCYYYIHIKYYYMDVGSCMLQTKLIVIIVVEIYE